ncbi:glycoside hydrolase family 3 N-terminal domain-containing protein [Bifidobacterium oedipodis]|uniref:Glycoside hydrolase n=1 Tax=Bifidobacterium oedipodis TaxID=2675322 RepID=A0A7Y0HS45_9BIFI|nr:glycoside hydrolase family 3 N-terminal domain-containing protein [Bifidobacterium sp. DSM 109957]NMM94770.1 glycoside hydrolase [Bifidobacterium sp. DSM 109957]
MNAAKKKKVRKPHSIRHSIELFFATLLVIVVAGVNALAFSMGTIIDGFVGAASPQVTAEQRQEITDKAELLAKQVESEGATLLRNENSALPLSADITQVNVFGWASSAWIGGGSGSGTITGVETDLIDALHDYGIATNTALTDMYRQFQDGREYTKTLGSRPEQSARLYEPSISDTRYYSQKLLDDAQSFSDTALVVIGRFAGESNDMPRQQYKRVAQGSDIVVDETRTSLQLSTEEEELLTYVGEHYDHVVVVLNTGNVMAIGQIETIPGVDACLHVGMSGQNAASAIPELLWGEVSPSGRTADTWAYDMATAASWANAGLEGTGSYDNADGLYPIGTSNGNLGEPATFDRVPYVDYAEGIYVGYKWYETADAEGYWNDVANEYGSGYDAVVQYPFGYGLSYTTFDWEVTQPLSGTFDGDDELSATVRVTNTGDVAGKDIVELYYSAPYTAGGIEKSALNLAAFAKTKQLAPGESQEVTLTLEAEDMACYDFSDANRNGFSGYELDEGDYALTLRRDAHTVSSAADATMTITLKENVQYATDSSTGNAVGNKFTGDDAIDGVSIDGDDSGQNIVYMTRADFAGTFPADNVDTRVMDDSLRETNLYDASQNGGDGDVQDVTTGANNGLLVEENGEITELGYQLGEDADDEQWDALLDQLTVSEMKNMFVRAYGNTAPLKSVGKSQGKDADGPAQIGSMTGMGAGTGFPSSSTMAQTWNTELAQEVGRIMGRQALVNGYSGWYAPAVNMHRSPLNGRNYEYYSEDAMLSGQLCGRVVQGAGEAGVYTYVKHFVCNDGEAGIYRDSVYTWMTEQALREVYLNPFRTIVEDYNAVGLMSAYGRIGAVWTGGSEALLTGVLRDEWGFDGAVITDYSDHHEFMNGDQALAAGGSLWMSGLFGGSLQGGSSSTQTADLRRAAKETLYMTLHVRAMNRDYVEATGDTAMERPVFQTRDGFGWRKLLAVVDVIALLLFALPIWGLVRDHKIRKARKVNLVVVSSRAGDAAADGADDSSRATE